jgi:hypothetical protein
MNIIIVCYYQLASQVVWDGWRWQADASTAGRHLTEQDARMEFRRIVARGALTDRDRAVVVADYGLVTEHVRYHLEDGSVVAGPLRDEVTAETITDEQLRWLVAHGDIRQATDAQGALAIKCLPTLRGLLRERCAAAYTRLAAKAAP